MSQGTDQVLVADVKVGERFRKELGDINAFAANLDEIGLLQPIGITPQNELIFGQRRLEAAKQLGWEWIPARVIDIGSLLLGEWAENEFREELRPSEKVAIGMAVEKLLGDRRGSNQFKDKSTPKEDRQIFVYPQNGRKTAEIAADAAGFDNPETYRQARKVVANGIPATVAAMDDGAISVSAAAKVADMEPARQDRVVNKVRDGAKPAKAVKDATPKETGALAILSQADVLLGKVVRLVDDAARDDRAGNRFADEARKGAQITRKAILAWKRGL
jgi:ParB-like chromosome segregation protein Spo0J